MSKFFAISVWPLIGQYLIILASYWLIEAQTASFTAFASVNSDDADSQETAFKSLCLHFANKIKFLEII